jgi:hypothetical protein
MGEETLDVLGPEKICINIYSAKGGYTKLLPYGLINSKYQYFKSDITL